MLLGAGKPDKRRNQMPIDLEQHGIRNVENITWNLNTPALYEQVIRRREGIVSHLGPLVVRTGNYTGRSPNDKFIVQEPSSENRVWWGKVNRPMDPVHYEVLRARLMAYFQGRDLFVQDCYAGADPDYRLPVRIVTETAWHSLFARNMFRRILDPEELKNHKPEFTVINAPNFKALPEIDGTNSEAFIIVHFGKKQIIIGGSSYAGEIKKSIFSALNLVLPEQKVLSMHCSANVGKDGDTALFFGLSGTGKTTLSADPDRGLIGDDEHGWSDSGVYNFEGGCYAKVIRLSKEAEPEIFACTRSFGTILENVAIDMRTRRVDLDDATLTENTRAAYPITHIPNCVRSGVGGHPRNIIMLTADAFGVLPPISKLTPEMAMYHFLSGYTAKVAGTERGIKEPQATFSYCFGAPFMALHPTVYAELLGEKIKKHDVDCWLVNTGWSGGPYGVGSRMKIAYTRAMVRAALTGALKGVEFEADPNFKVLVPKSCPGVPENVLNPRDTWDDKAAYDAKARELAGLFKENFAEFDDHASDEVKAAGPGT